MNWKGIFILASIALVFTLLKRLGQISPRTARTHLAQGARVIDVRSQAEYAAGHLRRAVNMPLDQIEAVAPLQLSDRSQVLLLHCQSGMRSAMAAKKLARMGYTQTFNLGSYARAARIVGT